MQINELLSLSKWFDNNIIENQIPQKYSILHSKMNQNIRRNGQSLVPFEQEKTDLIEAIIDLNFQSLSLEQIKFLSSLKIIELLGERGVEQIEQVLIQNNLDIATAIGKIKEFSNTITKAQNIFKELQTTLLKSFDIEETDEINGSQVLMRVYFQNDVAIKNLTDFKKLSATWYDIGRGIAMAQNKSPEDFNIIGAKKGSIILELVVPIGLASSVSMILLESLKIADRFISILKKVEELKALKLGNKKLALDLKKEGENERDKGTQTLLNTAIENLQLNAEQNGDKITALEKSIKKLIGFTQDGGIVDFYQPNELEKEKNNDAIREEIQKLKTNISEIRVLESHIKLLGNKINEDKNKHNNDYK